MLDSLFCPQPLVCYPNAQPSCHWRGPPTFDQNPGKVAGPSHQSCAASCGQNQSLSEATGAPWLGACWIGLRSSDLKLAVIWVSTASTTLIVTWYPPLVWKSQWMQKGQSQKYPIARRKLCLSPHGFPARWIPRYHSHANGWCHLGHVAVERSWHRSNCWSANWRPRSYLNHHDINILNICYRGTCMTKVIPTRKNENKQIQQNHTVLNEEYPAFIYYPTWHYVAPRHTSFQVSLHV